MFKGILIGLLVSMPMGAIGVLCIQRTLSKGKVSGFFSGMGAATADTFFATIAGLGVNYIIGFIEQQETLLKFGGSIVIILLGLKIFNTNVIKQYRVSRSHQASTIAKDYFSVLLLTLTNPLIIFMYVTIFASTNIVLNTHNYILSGLLLLGIFIGANLWWFVLSNVINIFRDKMRMKNFFWFNRISGSVILGFGVIALISLLVTNISLG